MSTWPDLKERFHKAFSIRNLGSMVVPQSIQPKYLIINKTRDDIDPDGTLGRQFWWSCSGLIFTLRFGLIGQCIGFSGTGITFGVMSSVDH